MISLERLNDLIAMLEVDELGIRKDSDTAKALRHYRELRRDAQRYQWLRQGENDELVLLAYGGSGTRPFDPKVDAIFLPRGERLDAAIDSLSPPEVTRERE